MKIIKGNYGECRFIDCIEGMKEIEDNTFDLCLTDYPFNVKYKGQGGKKKNNEKIEYEDSKTPEKYEKWCFEVFKEIEVEE